MCWSSHHHYRYEDRRWPTERSVSDPLPGATRVSDAERNRVVESLKQHTADGRLTLDEFEVRVDETLVARTRSDLQKVLRDLPTSDRERPRSRSTPPVAASLLPVIGVVAVLIGIVAGHLLLWPLFVIAFLWFRIASGHHRRARWRYDRPERPEVEDTVTYV